MVIHDKQVDNYKLFAGQKEIKKILGDIRYNLDDVVVRLIHLEHFLVPNLYIDSNDH